MGDGSKGFDGVKATQESHYNFFFSLLETEKEILQNKENIKTKVGV